MTFDCSCGESFDNVDEWMTHREIETKAETSTSRDWCFSCIGKGVFPSGNICPACNGTGKEYHE